MPGVWVVPLEDLRVAQAQLEAWGCVWGREQLPGGGSDMYNPFPTYTSVFQVDSCDPLVIKSLLKVMSSIFKQDKMAWSGIE